MKTGNHVLQFYITNEDFPKRVCIDLNVHRNQKKKRLEYAPFVKGYINVFIKDDDRIMGHCSCSECDKNVDLFDKYCSHCGARLIFRKIHESK